jgi:predicted phage-related endonuclease
MVGKLTPNNMISASRTPALLGLSPYGTRNELLAEMVAHDLGHPIAKTFDGNEATGWGDTLEPVILKETCKRLGILDADINVDKAFFHDSIHLSASLDGIGKGVNNQLTDTSRGIYCPQGGPVECAGEWGCLEAKLTSAAPEDQPPPWRGPIQLQAQMMVTGFSWGCVATLYRGIELRLFLYQADPDIQAQIADAVNEFEARRVNGDKYPIVSSEDGNHAFSKVDDGAEPIDLSGTQGGHQLVQSLLSAKAKKKEAEQEIDDAEAAIKEVMGEHEEAFIEMLNKKYVVKWPMRRTRAQPEKVVPAKPETFKRQNVLTVKEFEK